MQKTKVKINLQNIWLCQKFNGGLEPSNFLISIFQTGKQCNIKCPYGSYGQNCTEACNCQNGGNCDHISGACNCTPGWRGPM